MMKEDGILMRQEKLLNKIGIMGGTFDPIHLGHLFIAETALHNLKLDKILFIPTGSPPHKNNLNITPAHHRLIMAELAINDNPKFQLSDIEIKRNGKSYTIDTVRELKSIYKGVDFVFITGTDSFVEMETWENCRDLFKEITIVVARRLNYDNESFYERKQYFNMKYGAKIIDMRLPLLEISSSDIRDRIKKGSPIRYLVPYDVREYIKKHGLYKLCN